MRMTDCRLMRKLGVRGGVYEDCILHFNGRKKPWNVYSGVVDEEYWRYFKKTPWGSDDVVFDELYISAKRDTGSLIDKIMGYGFNHYIITIWSFLYFVKRFISHLR